MKRAKMNAVEFDKACLDLAERIKEAEALIDDLCGDEDAEGFSEYTHENLKAYDKKWRNK